MTTRLIVKSEESGQKRQREEEAHRVIARFDACGPSFRLLCFLDDKDWPAWRGPGMKANRGVFIRKRDWPRRVSAYLEVTGEFDGLVYLHGSTCSNSVSLTMTLAHEMQHVVQYCTSLKLWAENSLATKILRELEPQEFRALKLSACDIPHEREARIVAKRVAENLFGTEVVGRHIEAKMAEFVTEQDAADWDCIRTLETQFPYDLATETKLFFLRIKDCRLKLARALHRLQKTDDPDFKDVDLDALLA